MQTTLLKEAISPNDIKNATPTEDLFVQVSEAYIDHCINGTGKVAPSHQLKALDIYHDTEAPVRLMIIAALLNWKDAVTYFKQMYLDYNLPLSMLKETVQAVRTKEQRFLEQMYEKYCEPAFETIRDHIEGKSPKATDIQDKFRLLVRYMVKNRASDVAETYIVRLDDLGFEYYEGRLVDPQKHTGYFFIADCKYDPAQAKWKLTIYRSEYFSGTKETLLMATGQSWDKLLDKLNIYFSVPDASSAEYNLINESVKTEVDLTETIEKHDQLNSALFDDTAKLKPEVKDKINEIVNEFLKEFEEAEVELEVQDIILTGSNASYNYTKDSDLDIHIVADVSKIEDTLKLHKVIYDAYKSAFNKKFEIELNKVPVELYVETQDTPLVSNGIYSVVNDEWVKEPTKEDIPEVDQEAIDKAFKPWEKRYRALIAATTDEVEDEADIDKFIDSLYELRAKGLSTDGEYSIENLVFKEMRNKGYLDNLKELRHKVIARRLSLHENLESFADYLNVLDSLF